MFLLGQVVATPGALATADKAGVNLAELLVRHIKGDWGDLDKHDKSENDFAVTQNLRILSSYTLPDETTIWIVTEADRSATTFLLPSEY